ncbi:MAG: indole-3-glycerol-phosphate synthase [Proteobacteria bacterium]|nr:indole-3-glycerol-phosphate synthase [Pseudomonadota bacterium]
MSDFLKTMARQSADRASAAQGSVRSTHLDLPLVPLQLGAFDVIAEIKNRSPSEGALAAASASRSEQAVRYVEGGAAAISVLTEPTQFAGELAHLEEVVRAVEHSAVPVMRKDFLVDPIQVLEARATGASGVLLIVTMLSEKQIEDMLNCAYEHGMFVLLESFDAEDLQRSSALLDETRYREQAERGKLLFGVNTRDLRTLHVDPERLKTLGPHLPQGCACVAESGLHDGYDAAAAAGWGYSLALVGTALMRSPDPGQLIQEMLTAGRKRRAA